MRIMIFLIVCIIAPLTAIGALFSIDVLSGNVLFIKSWHCTDSIAEKCTQYSLKEGK